MSIKVNNQCASIVTLFVMCIAYPVFASAGQSRGIALEPVSPRASSPFAQGTYRALVIGNDEYKDEQGQWKELKTAVSDARAVSNLLANEYGFSDVQLLENATRRDVLLALEELSSKALPKDNVLVYYAGHGYLDSDSQRGFWVPVDAKGTDHTSFLRNSTIRDELTTIAS